MEISIVLHAENINPSPADLSDLPSAAARYRDELEAAVTAEYPGATVEIDLVQGELADDWVQVMDEAGEEDQREADCVDAICQRVYCRGDWRAEGCSS